MEFLRKRTNRLSQNSELSNIKGKFSLHRFENITFCINNITVIKKLVFSKPLLRSYLLINVKLESLSAIITLKKGSFTKVTNHQNTASYFIRRSLSDFFFCQVSIFPNEF